MQTYREITQEICCLRGLEGWSLNALRMKFRNANIERILKDHDIKILRKDVKVLATTLLKHEVESMIDLDGEIIKPPKKYKQLLKEAEKRHKGKLEILNL